jgi:hypothetical protein
MKKTGERPMSDWVKEIVDLTPLVRKLRGLRQAGKHAAAKRLLPAERAYSVPMETAQRLGIDAIT